MRPFLTSHHVDIPGKLHEKIRAELAEVASQYIAFMDNDIMYAANVIVEVRHTLRMANPKDNVQLKSTVAIGHGGHVTTP